MSAGTAIDAKFCQINAGIGFHRGEHVGDLEGYTFESRSSDVGRGAAAGKSEWPAYTGTRFLGGNLDSKINLGAVNISSIQMNIFTEFALRIRKENNKQAGQRCSRFDSDTPSAACPCALVSPRDEPKDAPSYSTVGIIVPGS